jgi:hypothetical protein
MVTALSVAKSLLKHMRHLESCLTKYCREISLLQETGRWNVGRVEIREAVHLTKAGTVGRRGCSRNSKFSYSSSLV